MIALGACIITSSYDTENRFEAELSEAVIESGSLISDYTNFKWDTAYIVKPYSSHAEQKKEKFPDYVKTEIEKISMTDYECVLVFTNNGKYVKHAKVRRVIFDFAHHPDVVTSKDKILL